MKIAFLSIYNGIVDRGAETYAKELADRLSVNHKVVVFQAGEAKGSEKYAVRTINTNINWNNKDSSGTLTRRFFVDYWSRLIAIFTLKCLGVIWKEKYDIVIPVNGGWQPAIVRIITWLMGSKMVLSGQTGIGWDERNNLWCFPDRFVALSARAANWAKKVNPFVKITTIPNGADLSKFNTAGEILQTNLKKPIIICAAALTPTKRVDLVINAVSQLKDVSLLVVGDGDRKEKLLRLGKKKLGERFLITKLPFAEMPKAYRAADLFTIVSFSYYAFEIVLVEAMATNLPVVANDDPIRKEIVGDAGIFVDPTDIKNYAGALRSALDKNWGDMPRKQAKKFDWDNIAEIYEKLFLVFGK